MSPSRARALRVVSLAAVLAAVPWRARTAPAQDNAGAYATAGEYMLHGFAAPDAEHLPLASAAAAALVRWGRPNGLYAGAGALLLALLVLAIEGELGSGADAWAAAAAVILLPWNYPQYFLSLFVLTVAGSMVWRRRSGTLFRTFVLSLSIGASLLFRSTLAFLPPALALLEFAPRLRPRARDAGSRALVLLLVPYLFLIPWISSNWRAHHRFIPFEDGEASCNIATGALGVVGTVEGPWRVLLKDSASAAAADGGVAMWAFREVVAHPLRYALASLTRAGLAIYWCSPWFFFALWALWVRRRNPEFQDLGLLCAYLLGIHCLMSIERAYFQPLLPLLAILSFSLLDPYSPLEPLLPPRVSRGILAGALASTLALSVCAAALLAAPALDARGLERAVALHPDDAWLLAQRGAERLALGDFSAAASDLARASALKPDDSKTGMLAEAALFQGDPARALSVLPREPHRIEDHLVRAGALDASDRSAALAEMRSAWNEWEKDYQVRGVQDPASREVLDAFLRVGADDFIRNLEDRLQAWPLPRRRAMAALIAQAWPLEPRAWIGLAEAASRLGRRSDALSALARAEELPLDQDQNRLIAQTYIGLEEPARALRRLDLLAEDAAVSIDKAGALALLGRKDDALAALARAERGNPDPQQRRRIVDIDLGLDEPAPALAFLRNLPASPGLLVEEAQALARLGRKDAAVSALDRAARVSSDRQQRLLVANAYSAFGEPQRALGLLALLPKDAEISAAKARILILSGNRAAALSELDAAQRLDSDDRQKFALALLRQDLKQYKEALNLLQPLLENDPKNPDFLDARAVSQYLSGSAGAAVSTLKESIRANPLSLPAYLTLGSIYTDQKRYPEALELYESALSKTEDLQMSSLRRKLSEDARWLKQRSRAP